MYVLNIFNNSSIKIYIFYFAATFDDDFYISSSNQPFEINQSQFFPGQKSNNPTDDIFEPNAADLTPLKPKNISMD